jgi:hypothetical protein
MENYNDSLSEDARTGIRYFKKLSKWKTISSSKKNKPVIKEMKYNYILGSTSHCSDNLDINLTKMWISYVKKYGKREMHGLNIHLL